MSEYDNQSAETAPLASEAPSVAETAAHEPAVQEDTLTAAPEAQKPASKRPNRWLVIGVAAAVGFVVLAGTFATGAAVGGRIGGSSDRRGAGMMGQLPGGQQQGERGHGRRGFDGDERGEHGPDGGRGFGHGQQRMPQGQSPVPPGQ